MTSKKAKPVIKLKPVAASEIGVRRQVASQIMSGLISSRGQYPLNGLQESAAGLAKTAVMLTDALLAELEKGP